MAQIVRRSKISGILWGFKARELGTNWMCEGLGGIGRGGNKLIKHQVAMESI